MTQWAWSFAQGVQQFHFDQLVIDVIAVHQFLHLEDVLLQFVVVEEVL